MTDADCNGIGWRIHISSSNLKLLHSSKKHAEQLAMTLKTLPFLRVRRARFVEIYKTKHRDISCQSSDRCSVFFLFSSNSSALVCKVRCDVLIWIVRIIRFDFRTRVFLFLFFLGTPVLVSREYFEGDFIQTGEVSWIRVTEKREKEERGRREPTRAKSNCG